GQRDVGRHAQYSDRRLCLRCGCRGRRRPRKRRQRVRDTAARGDRDQDHSAEAVARYETTSNAEPAEPAEKTWLCEFSEFGVERRLCQGARRPVRTASMNPSITLVKRSDGSTNSTPDL